MTITIDKKQELRKAAVVFAYVSLFVISIAALTTYFSTDLIRPIVTEFKENMGYSTAQVNLLSAVYSLPPIFFLLFSGIITDKLGVRFSSLLFMGLIVIGSYFSTVLDFNMILIGRILLGMGAESFFTLMNKIISIWFKDKKLAMAFGLNLLICRLGSIAAFNLLPWVVQGYSLKTALWIGAGLTTLGFLLTLLYCAIDVRGLKKGYVKMTQTGEEAKFNLKEALKLPASFWAISFLCMTYYSAIFPFTGVAKDFFYQQHGLDKVAAGRLTSLILIISMSCTWLFGLLIDKFGKRATLMIIGSLALIPCHVSMAYTSVPLIIPMIIMGLSFSLVPAALWPAVPLIIKEKNLGTAYGLIFMIQNLGLFAFEVLAAKIFDVTGSYKLSMVMFSMLGFLGLAFAIWLKILEKRGGGYLDTRDFKTL